MRTALSVWIPSLLDWQPIVATWTQKPLSNIPNSIAAEWRTADIIHGPISKPISPPNSLPEPRRFHKQLQSALQNAQRSLPCLLLLFGSSSMLFLACSMPKRRPPISYPAMTPNLALFSWKFLYNFSHLTRH